METTVLEAGSDLLAGLSDAEMIALRLHAKQSVQRDDSYGHGSLGPSEAFWEWAGDVKTRDEEKGLISPFPQWGFIKEAEAAQETHTRNIWLKPRQMFVTNLNCAKRLYRASRCDSSKGEAYLGLLLSLGEREALELMRRIWFMYESLPDYRREPVLKHTESELVFANGGRLLCLPASPRIGHSYTATDIFLDEWARLPYDREMHAGLMPTIGRQGRIDGVSTPNGQFNIFAEIWASDDPSWNKIELDWRDHPDRDDAWAEQEKKKLCPDENDLSLWLQQYEKHFEVFTEKRVYPGFTETHIDNELTFDPNETLYRGWDFGGHVAAVVFFQVAHGIVRVLRELIMTDHAISRESSIIVNPDNNIDDLAAAVLDRTKAWFKGYSRVRDFCDPQGAHVSDLSRKSQRSRIDVLNSYGIYPEYRFSNISEGVEIIRMRLRTRPDGEHGLTISQRGCPVLVNGFRGGISRRPAPPNQAASSTEDIRKDGWFEHCLARGTAVRMLSEWIPIEDLVDQEFWTYAYSHEEKRLVPVKAGGCRLTRRDAEVIKIQHDTGSLTLTPDHPVMLRDGTFRLAGDLHIGDSLMPFEMKKRGRAGSTLTKFNHKVLLITPAGGSDVFNLEVPGYLNFPANGIMVHNCHDAFRYAMVGVFRTTEIKRVARKNKTQVRYHSMTGVPV